MAAAVAGVVAAAAAAGCGTSTPTAPPAVTPKPPAVTWTADGAYLVEGHGQVLECEAIGDSKRERHLHVPASSEAPADGELCPPDWEAFADDHRESDVDEAKEAARPRRTATPVAPVSTPSAAAPSSPTGGPAVGRSAPRSTSTATAPRKR